MKPGERLHALDLLRGLAALVVVLWHWQHFQFQGSVPGPGFDRSLQPGYAAWTLLYEHGELAVDLFFTLSGHVFAWHYAEAVRRGRIGFGTFALRRFARLYPLHLLTFLLVALGQTWHAARTGSSFVYPHQDGWHAFLNLLMASGLGLEQGYSYNAPIWSVSVELLLYAVFYALCRAGLGRGGVFLALGLFGAFWLTPWAPAIGRGLGGFFLGAASHSLLQALPGGPPWRRAWACAGALGVLLGWGLVLAGIPDPVAAGLHGLGLPAPAAPGLTLLLFPATVALLARWQPWPSGTPPRPVGALGDLSYGLYLWHFPLQLACVLTSDGLGWPREVYQSGWTQAGFLILLLGLAHAGHRGVERPAQRWILARAPASRG